MKLSQIFGSKAFRKKLMATQNKYNKSIRVLSSLDESPETVKLINLQYVKFMEDMKVLYAGRTLKVAQAEAAEATTVVKKKAAGKKAVVKKKAAGKKAVSDEPGSDLM